MAVLFYILSICVYSSLSATFTDNYYLSSTSSFSDTWNAIYNSIYINNTLNNTFNGTYTEDYIFNITIMSNLTITSNVTSIDLPYFNYINRIILNIDCLNEIDLCDIYINNTSGFISGDPNSNSSTHLTLRISNIHFHVIGGQYSVLQIVGTDIIDIIDFNNIIIDCYSYCIAPIGIVYLSTDSSQHILMLNSIQFNDIGLPIYIRNGGHIIMNSIIANDCISPQDQDLFHFESIYSYNLSNIEIYHSEATSLIYISTVPYIISLNQFNRAILSNNSASYAVINVEHDDDASTDDIWSNIIISDTSIQGAVAFVIYFQGVSSNLYMTNIHLFNVIGGWWVILPWAVNTTYIDSCNITNVAPLYGAIGSLSGSIYIYNSILQYNEGIGVYFYGYTNFDTAIIENTIFQYNTAGVAILTNSISQINITNCIFKGGRSGANTAGAINIRSGIVIIRDSIFDGNDGIRSGGAITQQGNGRVEIYNSKFINNIAYHGGAIFLFVSGSGWGGMWIYDTLFANNIAHDGGAIRSDRGVYYVENVTFMNNTAKADGGAIDDVMGIEGCKVVMDNSTDYEYAAHIGAGTVFKSNRARDGGAIYTTNCNMYIEGEDTLFANNTAISSGGAILFDVSTSNISVWNTTFYGNYAQQTGGAVGISGGNIIFNECLFDNNGVTDGIGGGISLQVIEGFVSDNTQTVIFNSILRNNWAPFGGGIAVQTLGSIQDSYDDIDEYLMNVLNVTMDGNKVSKCGGGIYLNHGTLKLDGNKILNNTASKCGGGIYVENGGIFAISDIWNNNKAGDYGGGLMSNSPYIVLTNDMMINNNTADNYGGGIYLGQCPMIKSQILMMNNNNAGFAGSDVFVEHNKECNWTDFECNINNNNIDDNIDDNTFHSDCSTFPVQFNISWNIPSQFSHIDDLMITIFLYDGYGQRVSALSENERFVVSLEYEYKEEFENENCFILIGQHITQFDNELDGDMILKFNIVASPNCSIYEEEIVIPILFNLTLKYTNNFNIENNIIITKSFNSEYLNEIFKLPLGIILFGHIGNVICSLCVLITARLMYKHRNHQIIVGSRIPFMFILIIGLFMASFVLSMFVTVPWEMSCISYVWVFSISCLLIIMPLTAKTWAIYRVFEEAQNLNIFSWTTKKLFIVFICIPFSLLFIVLLIWSFTEGANDTVLVFDITNKYLLKQCSYNNGWLIFAFILVFIAVILLGYLAIKARHVPENWRESKYICGCILTLFIIFTFFVPLSFMKIGTSVQRSIRIISVFLCIQSVLIFLFYIKFNIVWNGKLEKKTIDENQEQDVISKMEASTTNRSILSSSEIGNNSKKTKKTFSLSAKRRKNKKNNKNKMNTNNNSNDGEMDFTGDILVESPEPPINDDDDDDDDNNNNNNGLMVELANVKLTNLNPSNSDGVQTGDNTPIHDGNNNDNGDVYDIITPMATDNILLNSDNEEQANNPYNNNNNNEPIRVTSTSADDDNNNNDKQQYAE